MRHSGILKEYWKATDAVRHPMWVESGFGERLQSRTGRNIVADTYIYPHFVPDGTVFTAITSTGSLPETLSEEEFFEGFSIPYSRKTRENEYSTFDTNKPTSMSKKVVFVEKKDVNYF